MNLRQHLKRLSVMLEIHPPEEVSPGVFKTTLSHPKLEGELSFIHSEALGRNETLKALDENIIGQLLDVLDVVGGILDGQPKKRPASPAPANPSRNETQGPSAS
jgi:hypothetical protein